MDFAPTHGEAETPNMKAKRGDALGVRRNMKKARVLPDASVEDDWNGIR